MRHRLLPLLLFTACTAGAQSQPADASACHDLPWWARAGSTAQLVFDHLQRGDVTGTETQDLRVLGPAMFESRAVTAVEVRSRSQHTLPRGGVSKTASTTTHFNEYRDARGVLWHGMEQSLDIAMPAGARTVSRAVYAPPVDDPRASLKRGQTRTWATPGRMVTQVLLPGMAPQSTPTPLGDTRQVTRFVGVERVTVPAGSFDACRFDEEKEGRPQAQRSSWLLLGRGLTLKVAVAADGTETVLRSGLIDGQPLRP